MNISVDDYAKDGSEELSAKMHSIHSIIKL